jgi:2-dehydro-3-deoxyphosphogluconate aldolase / (4S)-4-hydroxy-2-oxoglutarate aldolase
MTDRPPISPQLAESRVVAILRGTTAAQVVKASLALVEGGITCVEVTLNTAGALEAINELCSVLPPHVAVGAGTVLDGRMAVDAMAAGASFLVSPSVTVDVVDAGIRRGIPSYPGAYTPTEILTAWAAGAAAVKLFPAVTGGPTHLSTIRGPLRHIPLLPTGGISVDAAADYLRAGAVAVGLGSPLTGDLDGDIDTAALTDRARRLLAAVAAVPIAGGPW